LGKKIGGLEKRKTKKRRENGVFDPSETGAHPSPQFIFYTFSRIG
jgi:hypothetical protein